MNSCDKLPSLPTDFNQLSMMGVDKYVILRPESGQTVIQDLCAQFLLHFQKQQEEDLVMTLASIQETELIKKFNKILIQFSCNNKLESIFIFISACACKNKHLRRQGHIEVPHGRTKLV
jgi:hypothetical protein